MRIQRIALHGAALAVAIMSAAAAHAENSATGVWIDHTGRGAVEITDCNGKLCGHVAWVEDAKNSDQCGKQIIGNVKSVGKNKWDNGWIYNPDDGSKYDVELTPVGADKLKVVGYAGTKWLSETYTWKRAPADLKKCNGSGDTAAAATPAPAASVAADKPAATTAKKDDVKTDTAAKSESLQLDEAKPDVAESEKAKDDEPKAVKAAKTDDEPKSTDTAKANDDEPKSTESAKANDDDGQRRAEGQQEERRQGSRPHHGRAGRRRRPGEDQALGQDVQGHGALRRQSSPSPATRTERAALTPAPKARGPRRGLFLFRLGRRQDVRRQIASARDGDHLERFGDPAHLNVRRHLRVRIPAGLRRHLARQDELHVLFFGQRLEAAGDVDGIADDGEVDGFAVADAAEQQRTRIDADADGERTTEFRLELGVDAIERQIDVARRAQRLPASRFDAVTLAEHGEQSVAEELVDPAAVRGDRGADHAEELVEHVDDVERQAASRRGA